jgi:uncharacterized protein YgiM (DUF1202 family)
MNNNYDSSNNNDYDNKYKGIVGVVAMIAAASLLSLGAVAAPAYAGGDDEVKQKAEAKADCDQKNKVDDGSTNVQTNAMGACVAAAINVNELIVVGGAGLTASASEDSTGEFSPPSTP